MSRSWATAANSLGAGRAPGVVVVAPPPAAGPGVVVLPALAPVELVLPVSDVPGCACAPLPVPPAAVDDPAAPAAPVGAGADACVVAGRLAHPANTAAMIRSESSVLFAQRLVMSPPFACVVPRWQDDRILSRQPWRPRWTCVLCGAAH